MESLLLARLWEELSGNYSSDQKQIRGFWQELKAAYDADDRYYHNLSHLTAMCKLALQYKSELNDLDAVLFSIFYHDIVYRPGRKNNEQQSAEIAKMRLTAMDVELEKTARVYAQIIATADHRKHIDQDTNFLLDFELAILAGTAEDYQNYCREIRQEYASFPGFIYRKGRRKVLKQFLSRSHIYQTEVFRSLYERDARFNLEQELAALS